MQDFKALDPQLHRAVDRAICLGRHLAAEVERLAPGRDSAETGLLRRCLAAAADGHPLRDIDDGGLVAVRERLVAACRREERERRRVFRGIIDPEGDDHGAVETIPVYSPRGEDFVRLLQLYDAFLTAREVARVLLQR